MLWSTQRSCRAIGNTCWGEVAHDIESDRLLRAFMHVLLGM